MKNKKPQIIPRGEWVLVKPDSEESRVSKHGIITPTSVEQEKKSTGEVIEIGDYIDDIKKGDKVVFGTYSGESLKFEGVDYKLIHSDDIVGFLK